MNIKKTIQSQNSDMKAFTTYLDSIANKSDHIESWEFKVLGGFGGYKSQVRVNSENVSVRNTKMCK